jgi:hypothetical protein
MSFCVIIWDHFSEWLLFNTIWDFFQLYHHLSQRVQVKLNEIEREIKRNKMVMNGHVTRNGMRIWPKLHQNGNRFVSTKMMPFYRQILPQNVYSETENTTWQNNHYALKKELWLVYNTLIRYKSEQLHTYETPPLTYHLHIYRHIWHMVACRAGWEHIRMRR